MQWRWPRFFSTSAWLEKQQTSILSAATIITVANIISSISGLIRQRLLIAHFFNTPDSQQAFEALLVAFQIPDLMFQLIIIGAVSAAFIPVFTHLRKQNQEEAFTVSAMIMNLVLLIFCVAAVVVWIFAEPLTAMRTGDEFTAEQVVIAANLTRIMLFAQVFFAISTFLSGMLQSFQRFIIPSLAPILYNLGIISGVYLFSDWWGIYSAGAGVILGAFLHMAIQLPLAYKLGFRFKPWLWSLRNTSVREILRLVPPRVSTLGVNEIQNLALGFFATSLGQLSFVIVRLALTLMAIPIRLFGVPISQASLPFLSAESAESDRKQFMQLVRQSMGQIAFLALPASVLLLVLRIPIVRLAFGTKNFPWEATVMTGRVVAVIAISVAAQALAQLLIRSFHALKDTKTPFLITSVSVATYCAIAAATVFWTNWGVLGIALATSVAAILEAGLLLLLLQRSLPGLVNNTVIIPQAKMLLASFLMAVFLYLPFRIFDELIFDTSRTIELIALTITTGTIGMGVYVYFAALFDIQELHTFLRLITGFGPWRKLLSTSEEVLVESPVETDDV